jgi:hypothetical protein
MRAILIHHVHPCTENEGHVLLQVAGNILVSDTSPSAHLIVLLSCFRAPASLRLQLFTSALIGE